MAVEPNISNGCPENGVSEEAKALAEEAKSSANTAFKGHYILLYMYFLEQSLPPLF